MTSHRKTMKKVAALGTTLTTAARIAKLKRDARRYRELYLAELDAMDCGAELGAYIRPDMNVWHTKFKEAMRELKAIDKSFPEHIDVEKIQ